MYISVVEFDMCYSDTEYGGEWACECSMEELFKHSKIKPKPYALKPKNSYTVKAKVVSIKKGKPSQDLIDMFKGDNNG